MFLPTLTLTLAYLGEYYILMRSSLLEVLGEEYVTTVRAKGIREQKVLWHTPSATRCCRRSRSWHCQLRVRDRRGGDGRAGVLLPRARAPHARGIGHPGLPLLQGMFLFFSLAVIVWRTSAADLIYS